MFSFWHLAKKERVHFWKERERGGRLMTAYPQEASCENASNFSILNPAPVHILETQKCRLFFDRWCSDTIGMPTGAGQIEKLLSFLTFFISANLGPFQNSFGWNDPNLILTPVPESLSHLLPTWKLTKRSYKTQWECKSIRIIWQKKLYWSYMKMK